MKYLNVIDLDKTLITIDSFRYMVLKKMDFILLMLVFLRTLKIISRYKFTRAASKRLKKTLSNEKNLEKLTQHLITKVNKAVLERLRQQSTGDTVTVILSASPQEYVTKFAEHFGFLGMGSRWEGEKFFHCYGANKKTYIEANFPKEDYIYNFAISDSKADNELLSLFKTGILYESFG